MSDHICFEKNGNLLMLDTEKSYYSALRAILYGNLRIMKKKFSLFVITLEKIPGYHVKEASSTS